MREILVTENPDPGKGQISFEERELQLKEQEKREAEARKREKQSPYKEFAQLNLSERVNEKVMYELSENPAASKLFWFISNHMDGYNALIASYKIFEEALGMSESTITRGIRKLKAMGLLYVKKSGSSNVYLMNPNVIWKSWGNNMKYCEFPAKIMLSLTEQCPDAKEIFSNQMHRVIEKKEKGKE